MELKVEKETLSKRGKKEMQKQRKHWRTCTEKKYSIRKSRT